MAATRGKKGTTMARNKEFDYEPRSLDELDGWNKR
jgi:hypothetical protein